MTQIFKTHFKIFIRIASLGLILFFTTLNFTQAAESKSLPLPDKENYDSIIKENKFSTVLKNQGIETGLKAIFFPDGTIVKTLNVILGAVAILWLFILGFKFIFSQGEEDKITKYKTQFGWIVLGLILISIAEYAAFIIFDPSSKTLLDASSDGVEKFETIMISFVKMFQVFVGGVVLLAGVRSGLALITGGDQDEVVQKEKTFVKIFLFAIALIILAETLIRGVIVVDRGEFNALVLVREIVGLINFILGFLAAAATFMVVLASLYYVASFGDDEMTSKAKTMITNSLIGLIIAYSSYSIVQYFITIL